MIIRMLPHINIVFSLIMLVLFVINKINAGLGVLKGAAFEAFLLILIIVSFATSAVLIVKNRQHKH